MCGGDEEESQDESCRDPTTHLLHLLLEKEVTVLDRGEEIKAEREIIEVFYSGKQTPSAVIVIKNKVEGFLGFFILLLRPYI